MQEKADSDQVRQQNRALVLTALRRAGPIARVDLGRDTGLSAASVSAITGDLLEEQIVRLHSSQSDNVAQQGRGRPRVLLELNPNAAKVMGIKLSRNVTVFQLFDYAGNSVATRSLALNTTDEDIGEFVDVFAQKILDFLEEVGTSPDQVSELRLALQGTMDDAAGVIIWSPAFSVPNVRLVGPLSARLNIPVFISNDANMLAQAMLSLNPSLNEETFALILLDHGIGMGLMINGQLFTGTSGAATEFGHVNHMPAGALCRCGRRGCLEAYAAPYAIYRRFEKKDVHSRPREFLNDPSAFDRFVERADAGEEGPLDELDYAGEALGYGIARAVALLDPSKVIIAGEYERLYKHMRVGIQRGMEAALVDNLARHVEILTFTEFTEPDRIESDLIAFGLKVSALRRLDTSIFTEKSSTD
jgi:predicted NBD/HSP70 family sugar kinase